MEQYLKQPGKPLFSRAALTALILPLICEQFLGMAVGMADTVMITTVGETAVSSVSVVNAINNLIILLLSALATGGAVVCAQYIGRHEFDNAQTAGQQLLYAAVALMLAVTAVCTLLRGQILSLIYRSLEPAVFEGAKTYFLITSLSYPFLAIYNTCAALFRAMGNSRVSMRASFIMNLINICGNALLIYGLGWGVAGAAAATLFSRIVSSVLMLRLIRNPANVLSLKNVLRVRLRLDMIRRILRIGLPSGVENSVFQLGKLLVAGLVASLGTSAIAANAIVNSIWGMMIVPGYGLGISLVTIVGQCMGAREYAQAQRYTFRLLLITHLCLTLTNLPALFFAESILRLFNLSEEAVRLSLQVFPIIVLCDALLWPWAFGLTHALRAAGDTRYTMVISIVSVWAFRVGLSYVFVNAFGLGYAGMWYAMATDWAVRAACFAIRFFGGRWKRDRVIG